MPPPPAETSPRRRPLGRGPGTSPQPTPEEAGEAGERREAVGAAPAARMGEAVPDDGRAEPEGPDEAIRARGPEAEQAVDAEQTPDASEAPDRPAGRVEADEPTSRPRTVRDGSVRPMDGSVPPRDGSVPPTDGSVPPADGSGTPASLGGAAGGSAEGGAEGGAERPGDARDGRFTVRLANFEGPFDLLLQLISKHKLDVTEVALSKVTDEFMGHIRAMGPEWDLDQTTEFLVVAATLLDLKAARLLPAAEVEDEADLALLEARDLLFARLLQYRAYKQVAEIFGERWEAEGRRHPRTVGLEPHHAELLPEVVISIGAEGFAKLAVKAMQPRAKPQVYVDHIHAPLVSVREQAAVVVALLRERGTLGFRELVADADDTLTVVARFLALLELYREKAVALDQETPLGDLTVSWTGGETDAAATAVTDEFDQEPRAPEEAAP
ncbi:segregation/condensation protein A [Streptomyces sp. NPDC126499]|uniref:segregation and condensation protein A n=1 Tax=Streptomyces sp. NPDC126499 TaxID=3155314 RepID=UPI003317A07D